MMNDRFASQLRQHLLDSADERPADGQLAAVVDAIAGTNQRIPLVARLTWNPGRIGPVPSAAIRYGLIAVALALATVAGAILGFGSQPRPTVFEGSWTTIDPGDASGMTLVVGPGMEPAVYFEDGYASGAACRNSEVKRFTARGTATIVDDRLDVRWPDGGTCGLLVIEMGEGSYTHDPATDTLVDGLQQTWSRPLVDRPPATREPARPTPQALETPTPPTEAPETQAPSTPSTPTPATPAVPSADPVAKCFDIPAGETYSQSLDDLSLAITIPDSAAFRWQGYRDGFLLAQYCLLEAPVRITASPMELIAGSCGAALGRPIDAAMAVQWLTESPDYATSEPTQVAIGGYPATRLEASFESTPCVEGVPLWSGAEADPDATGILYVVDVEVDGVPLGIAIINRRGEGTPAQVAEAEALIASMVIEP